MKTPPARNGTPPVMPAKDAVSPGTSAPFFRSVDGWSRSSYQRIYDNSPTLQQLSRTAFASPLVLTNELIRERSTIESDLERAGGEAGDHALCTFVEALVAAGVIMEDAHAFMRFATARELYDRSDILQNISPQVCASPETLLDELIRLRPAIIEEQRVVRGVDDGQLERYSLGTLVHAMVAAGRLEHDYSAYSWMAGSRDLYDRSPLLQSIDDSVLSSPEELVETLITLRPRILVEQRELRGVSEKELPDYALGTLIAALIEGGRITSVERTYLRAAMSRELYDRSEILQNISDDDLASSRRLISILLELRTSIVDEQRALQTSERRTSDNYALVTLVDALVGGGRPVQDIYTSRREAGARDLYDRSPLLQGITSTALSSPECLVEELVRLQPLILEEQRTTRGLSDEELSGYALSTLAQALALGGRITSDEQQYQRFASSRDLYNMSPLLQSVSDDDVSTPQKFITVLLRLRPKILAEQRKLRGVAGEKLDRYALMTLASALIAGGRITHQAQVFQRRAGGRDFFDRSKILQGVPPMKPKKLMDELVRLRRSIVEEQRIVRGVTEKQLDDYSLSTLVGALVAGGTIDDSTERYSRLSGSRELYERSPILQGIAAEDCQSPETLIPVLIALRDSVVSEQRARKRSSQKRLTHYALGTLVTALWAGGRIAKKPQAFERLGGWYDLYHRSPTLMSIGNGAPNMDDEGVMAALLVYRDCIAVESLTELGELPESTDGIEDYYALSTLVSALYAAGVLDKKRFTRLNMSAATPLEYFLKRRDKIESQIERTAHERFYMKKLDLTHFTQLKDFSKQLSGPYITRIVKWTRWLLANPAVSLRSMYRADELAFMVLFGSRDRLASFASAAVSQLELAGYAAAQSPELARSGAVQALKDIVSEYGRQLRLGTIFDEETAEAIREIERLVDWSNGRVI